MNKLQVTTIEELDLYYDKCRKIRFHFNIEINSIEQILDKMLWWNNSTLETIYPKGGLHCPEYRYRSLDDIIKVCKFYFPKITVKEILIELNKYEELKNEELKNEKRIASKSYLNFRYCPNIRKYNFGGKTIYGFPFFAYLKKYDFSFYNLGFPNLKVKFVDYL